MGVKCLAQEHNTVPWPGLDPGPFHPESSALTIRPPRLLTAVVDSYSNYREARPAQTISLSVPASVLFLFSFNNLYYLLLLLLLLLFCFSFVFFFVISKLIILLLISPFLPIAEPAILHPVEDSAMILKNLVYKILAISSHQVSFMPEKKRVLLILFFFVHILFLSVKTLIIIPNKC